MNAMSTSIKKLNWRKLRNDSLVKERWGDIKVVFEYNNLVSTISVYQIVPQDDDVWFSVKSIYTFNDETYKDTSLIRIPLSDEHYNEDIFQKKLVRAITSTINGIEGALVIDEVGLYQKFCDVRDETTLNFLSDVEDKYKELDDIALQAVLAKAKEDISSVESPNLFVYRLKDFMLTTHYVTLANFFEDEDLYNLYSQYLSVDFGEKCREVYNKAIDRMTSDLEGLYIDWELA